MQHCPWCYRILDDFNRLIEDMNEWYGPDKVAIISIDGPHTRDLTNQFGVSSYPTFSSVLPNKNGSPNNNFRYQPRGYDSLKRWMLETLGDTPLREGAKLPTQE